MEAQIADIRAEFKTEEAEVKKFIKQEKLRQTEGFARSRGDGPDSQSGLIVLNVEEIGR